MQVIIDKSRNIEGSEGLSTHISSVVEATLHPMRDHITRVEVHVSDENGPKGAKKTKPDDIRCVMLARLQHHQPVSVSNHDASLHDSIHGAAHKLLRLVESTLGRIHDKNPRGEPATSIDDDMG